VTKSARFDDGTKARIGQPPPAAVMRLVSEAARRLSPDAPLTRDAVMGLQPAAGNGAVQRLVSVQRNKKAAAGVASSVMANNGAPPAGYVGGRVFENRDGDLPEKDAKGNPIRYWEYDVYKYVEGRNRGKVRVVIDSNWTAWYTNDHYRTFSKLSY
jgi:guanyl-specific ribonuclease Sa